MAKVAIVSPILPQSTSGNDITANRWAQLIESEHSVLTVQVDEQDESLPSDSAATLGQAEVLIALHGRRSATAIQWWRDQQSPKPLIVALTGTDLYSDLPNDPATIASTEAADAVIVLQTEAVARLQEMNPAWAAKAQVIHQSVAGPHPPRQPTRLQVEGEFRVVVLAHLRPVKDPLLCARAARLLPPEATVTVHHAGGGMGDDLGGDLVAQAEREREENPRYHWYGGLDRRAAKELLASADVLACTSISEGGANVVSEAIALGVPVIGTRMDGNVGLLGADHPGLVPVGDSEALAQLFVRLESDKTLLAELQARTDALQPLTEPATEQKALIDLVDELL